MNSMDFYDWEKQFKPVVFNQNQPLVDKYLTDEAALDGVNPLCVWSFVEGDGNYGVVEGKIDHAEGFLVTEVPAEVGTSYNIDYYEDGGDWSEDYEEGGE